MDAKVEKKSKNRHHADMRNKKWYHLWNWLKDLKTILALLVILLTTVFNAGRYVESNSNVDIDEIYDFNSKCKVQENEIKHINGSIKSLEIRINNLEKKVDQLNRDIYKVEIDYYKNK